MPDDQGADLVATVERIVALVDDSEPRCGSTRLVCIDGPSGAGKTTLAESVSAALAAPVVHMDDLYPGWDGLRAGTLRAQQWVVEPLRAAQPVRYRRWDWNRGAYADWVQLPPSEVVVLEGCGAGALPVGGSASVLVWVDADVAVRHARGLTRDPGYAPFWGGWAAQERRLYDTDRTVERADLVVDTTRQRL
jgi:uridine kinase